MALQVFKINTILSMRGFAKGLKIWGLPVTCDNMVERFSDRNIDNKSRLFLPRKYAEPGIPYTFEMRLFYVSPDPERIGREEFPYLLIEPIDVGDLNPDDGIAMDVDDLGTRHSYRWKRGINGDVRTDKARRLKIEDYELDHCRISTKRTNRYVFLLAYPRGHFEVWSSQVRKDYDGILKKRLRLRLEEDSDRHVSRDLRELAGENKPNF